MYSKRAEKELDMPFILCPAEWWSVVIRPSSYMQVSSEFSPDFPQGTTCPCQRISQMPARLPRLHEHKSHSCLSWKLDPPFFEAQGCSASLTLLYMHLWGSGGAEAPRSLPMDGTLVNVNGQIVWQNEFHPSFPALGQVVFMFVGGDCITNCLCVLPVSWE